MARLADSVKEGDDQKGRDACSHGIVRPVDLCMELGDGLMPALRLQHQHGHPRVGVAHDLLDGERALHARSG